MAGAIAGAAGQIPEDISRKAYDILSPDLQMILDKFEHSIKMQEVKTNKNEAEHGS